MFRRAAAFIGLACATTGLGWGQGPATTPNAGPAPTTAAPLAAALAPSPAVAPPQVNVVISVPDQKLAVLVNGKVSRAYKVSTSRYGEGDSLGSWRTPLGHLEIANKIGGAAPTGAVFKGRQLTGEVLSPNAPGRDPIVSRIIWLRGMEQNNRHAYQRCIYIHGTPQETFLGRKASFGCIRMRSADVVEIYNYVNVGTDVAILEKTLSQAVREAREASKGALARNTVAKVASAPAPAPAPTGVKASYSSPRLTSVTTPPAGPGSTGVRTDSVH